MRQERFTEKALEAVQNAAELAREHGNQSVEPEHLILALINQEEGVARTLVERAGASVQALEPALVSTIERLPKVSGGQTYLSDALSKHLQQAEREAERLKDEYISTEHLLLALADLPVLKDAGATHEKLLSALVNRGVELFTRFDVVCTCLWQDKTRQNGENRYFLLVHRVSVWGYKDN